MGLFRLDPGALQIKAINTRHTRPGRRAREPKCYHDHDDDHHDSDTVKVSEHRAP
jgi:hypothetical protein